ncbi:hypothetical protein CALCODRAFT_107589 [Calocera cornea HHB12733]|uniref:F-box domain-containing protein n=1 Tax=Calocera cornea HHB12733 TaxID=1353952 RepID=A0A165IGG0_9BASI|nr:hypothetical protein CALCODRAFT_107589 [Calocera cornea HHB12733]
MTTSSPFSLFDKLPPELVAEIFDFGVHSPGRNTGFLCSLPAVCRRFRDIALATSTLWTRLCLPIPFPTLEEWVRRGKPHLLDVEIDPDGLSGEDLTDLRRNLRDCDIMFRCRSLTVDKCAHFLVPDVLCVPWSNLRSLEVEFCTFDDDYECQTPLFDDEWAIDLLGGHAEKIRELRLREVAFDWTRLSIRDVRVLDITLPSATWSMELPTVQQFLDTLATLQHLQVLSLDNWTFSETVNGVHVPFKIKRDVVHMTNLRKVTFYGPTIHHLRLFLPFIEPASKCEVHIHVGRFHLAEDIDIPLAPAFFSQVHSVSFYGLGNMADWDEVTALISVPDDFFIIRESDLLRTLRQTPSLRFLNIEALRFSDGLLRQLTARSEQSEAMVPQLEGLRIARCHRFSEDALKHMIQSRAESWGADTAQLRCVVVEWCPELGRSYVLKHGENLGENLECVRDHE